MAIQFPPINVGDPEPQDGDDLSLPNYVNRSYNVTVDLHFEVLNGLKEWLLILLFVYRGGIEIFIEPAPTDAIKATSILLLMVVLPKMTFDRSWLVRC